MTRPPAKFLSALRPALVLSFIVWGATAHAAITARLGSITVANYTGYLIDADAVDPGPGTDRNVILAQSTVRFEKISGVLPETRISRTTQR